MQEKRSFYLLLLIMSVVAFVTMAVTNIILYRVAFEERSQSLVQTAQSQARLIEAMARYNRKTNRIDWETPVGERGPTSLLSERAAADTISQLKDAHQNYAGFGKTGEFVLAGIENQQIVFLLNHRHDLTNEPAPIPLYSDLAEPIRRALMVESGVMVGKDYRGVTVLAAYEPVDVLNFGIVAKIDLAEIQAPFIKGAVYTSLISMLVIFLGGVLFRRITNPIVERIVESEQQYRSLVEDIAEWVWETDKDGVIIYSSPVVTDLLGYSVNEITATPVATILNNSDSETISHQLTNAQTVHAFSNFHTQVKAKNGNLIHMEFSANPTFDAEANFAGYRGVARDISLRIESEKLRQQYQETLEQQVKERTQELHEINEELKSFTYIVSHDLRSPLVSIVGFSSELKEDLEELKQVETDNPITQNLIAESIPESILYIDKAAEKMESLINSILALSRLGHRSLEISEVDTAQLVDLNLKALAYQLEGVSVSVAQLPVIKTDETSLAQIFGNLLGNAVKYLRTDIAGKIDINCVEEDEFWQFDISDNGHGIAVSDIPHIFDLFKRVGTQEQQGEGMGLTYVQTLVRRLGGKIYCTSVLGEGSTFSFTLPKN
jgi:PAS domain S-box-containing protein